METSPLITTKIIKKKKTNLILESWSILLMTMFFRSI